jgi:putative inorganic carbon (HCO3(-)) transporter
MKNTSKLIRNIDSPKSVLLPALLLGLTAATAIVMVKLGLPMAMLIVLGALGLGVGIFMIAYPEFAFYVAISSSFFVFCLLRLIGSDIPLVTLIDVMVWVTFVAVLIQKGIKGESFWKYCNSPIMLMYLIILVYTFLEYFNPNGGNKELYFLFLRRVITLLLFLYCVLQLLTNMRAIDRFFKAVLILMFVSALYGCYESWFGMPAFELNYITSDPLRAALASLDGGGFRISSFLPSCMDFGLLMAASTIIFLALYLRLKTTRRRKRLFLVAMICSALSMSYSGTRTATLMLIVMVVLYVLMTINERKTMIFSSIFGFLLLAVIFGPSYGNGQLRRLKSTFDLKSEESLNVRDMNRHAIQPYIYGHPIGGGVGTTGVLYISYNRGHPLAGFPTDSGLLAIVLEYGVIGLLIHCLTYFIILQQGVLTYYQTRDPKRKIYLLASVLFVFGFVFAQYAQVAIGQLPNGFVYLGLNAVIIRLQQMEKEKQPSLTT